MKSVAPAGATPCGRCVRLKNFVHSETLIFPGREPSAFKIDTIPFFIQ